YSHKTIHSSLYAYSHVSRRFRSKHSSLARKCLFSLTLDRLDSPACAQQVSNSGQIDCADDITVDATTAGKRRLNPVDPKAFGSPSNPFAESMRNVVQAAAENTSTFATMTGDAFISTPYITQSSAPNIWASQSSDGRGQKYDPTNTAVAPHPKYSVPE